MKLSVLFLCAIIADGRNLKVSDGETCESDEDCKSGNCQDPGEVWASCLPGENEPTCEDCTGTDKECFRGVCAWKDCKTHTDCESENCVQDPKTFQKKCSLYDDDGIPEFRGYKSWRGISVDYPKPLLRPVGHQGCDDGYAWAGTFTFNNRLNIMNNHKDIKLSVMDGSSCHKVIKNKKALEKNGCPYPANNKYSGNSKGKSMSGCDGGDPGKDIFAYAKKKGMVEDACMPYRCKKGGDGKDDCSVNKAFGQEGACASNVCTVRFDSMTQPRDGRFKISKNGVSDKCTDGPNEGKKAKVHKLLDWKRLDLKTYPLGPGREEAIIRALDDGPVTFGAKYFPPCNLQKFVTTKKTKKQIFTLKDQKNCMKKKQQNDIDLMLVGYGEEKGTKFWEVQGSLGTKKFGDSGFFRIERDWALCNAGKDIAIPIVEDDNWKPKDTSRSRRMQAAEDEDLPEVGEWQHIPDDSDVVLEASRHAAMAELTDECYQYVDTGAGSVIVDGDTARVRSGAVQTFRFTERINGGSGACRGSSGEYQCTVQRDFMSEDPTNIWRFPDCIKIGDLPPAATTTKDGVIIALSVLTALFGLGCMVLTCYIMNMPKPGPTPLPPNPSPTPPPHSYGNTEYALNQSAE